MSGGSYSPKNGIYTARQIRPGGEFTESDFTGPLKLIWLRGAWKLATGQ
jgi:hypothetical protein